MDMLANTFMRAPGESVGTFALECAIDELAEAMRHRPDRAAPIRNEPEKDPTSGTPFSSRHLVEAYRRGRRAVRLGRRATPTPRSRARGRMADRHGLRDRHLSLLPHAGRRGADHAHRGRPRHGRDRGARDGHGHRDRADAGRRRAARPRDRAGDVRLWRLLAAGRSLAGGSSQTASIGAAVIAAQRRAGRPSCSSSPATTRRWPASSRTRSGAATAACASSTSRSAARAMPRSSRARGATSWRRGAARRMPLEMQQWSMHSYGAQFCEVRVNAVTGETRVSRFLGSFDCGRILNAKTAASQFRGGIIMGLGLALMEETQFDERNGPHHEPVARRISRAGAPGRARDRRDLDRHPRSAQRRWARAASARSASPASAPRSPTRSTTPPASASATCRSRWTSCLGLGLRSRSSCSGPT